MKKKFVCTHVILTTFTSSQFHCIWVDSDVKKLWHPNVCRDCKLRVQTWRLSDMVIIASQLCVHYWNWNMIKYVSTTLRLTRFVSNSPPLQGYGPHLSWLLSRLNHTLFFPQKETISLQDFEGPNVEFWFFRTHTFYVWVKNTKIFLLYDIFHLFILFSSIFLYLNVFKGRFSTCFSQNPHH